jgi:predicted DNA-binding transcriptional regulator AlpA
MGIMQTLRPRHRTPAKSSDTREVFEHPPDEGLTVFDYELAHSLRENLTPAQKELARALKKENALSAYRANFKISDILAENRISHQTFYAWVNEAELPQRPSRWSVVKTPAKIDELVRLTTKPLEGEHNIYGPPLSVPSAALILGLGESTAYRWLAEREGPKRARNKAAAGVKS